MRPRFFVCPAKLADPVAACQRPRPVHGEENPIRKGVGGQRRGLKEAIGGRWNVAKVNPFRLAVGASVQKDVMPDSCTATGSDWGRNHRQGAGTVSGEAWHHPSRVSSPKGEA